jgi:hypothetical protein
MLDKGVLTIIATGVTTIVALAGLWWQVESKMQEAIDQSTDLITAQIVRNAIQLAELHVADLEVRHRILKREIATYPPSKAPERMYILLDALQSQIVETKEKQW